jgi:hypothetical protein
MRAMRARIESRSMSLRVKLYMPQSPAAGFCRRR